MPPGGINHQPVISIGNHEIARGVHLAFLWGFFRVLFRVSLCFFRVSLGFLNDDIENDNDDT